MFQDDAGTVAVTGVEQPVRRWLDKSGNGNHATASADARRPVLSARYNTLQRTEDFGDAFWRKSRASASITTETTDPLGGSSANKIVETTETGRHQIFGGSGTAQVFLIYVKAAERSILGVFSGTFSSFDLTTGVATGAGASMTAVNDGWFKCVCPKTNLNEVFFGPSINTVVDNDSWAYTGDGTSGIYVWGADLRPANDGVGLPDYQRVTTSTDYNTVGFPRYLRFDGTDDCLVTSNVDFSSTAQVTVCAGVRKISDAAQGVVAELSATIASNDGTFLLAAPDGASATFGWDSKGTAQVDAVASGVAAPITRVVTGTADISGDSAIIRLNGSVADTDTGDQGTGNFGEYPLFVGARNDASARLNGRIYQLLGRSVVSDPTTLGLTEAYVNSKTRAF
jgi:hypothetical protein